MEMNKIFLKYMDIEGYKNFYNRVHVDFSPHLNIVAGPPKFGKSNLLNAINWTLLDTDGTDNTPETIIFHGNKTIKPYDFAEVTLCYGKENNEESIIIKHRLERSGNNFWQIDTKQYDSFESFKSHLQEFKFPELCLIKDFNKSNRNVSNHFEELLKQVDEKQCIVEICKEINWHKISNKKIPNCLIGIYPSENDVIKVIALIDRMGD